MRKEFKKWKKQTHAILGDFLKVTVLPIAVNFALCIDFVIPNPSVLFNHLLAISSEVDFLLYACCCELPRTGYTLRTNVSAPERRK